MKTSRRLFLADRVSIDNGKFNLPLEKGVIHGNRIYITNKKDCNIKNKILKQMDEAVVDNCASEEISISVQKTCEVKNCPNLKRLKITTASSITIYNCPNLEELILPRMIRVLNLQLCDKIAKIKNKIFISSFTLEECESFNCFDSFRVNFLTLIRKNLKCLKINSKIQNCTINNSSIDFIDNINTKYLRISNSSIKNLKVNPRTEVVILEGVGDLDSFVNETLELDELELINCFDLRNIKVKTVRQFILSNLKMNSLSDFKSGYLEINECVLKNVDLKKVEHSIISHSQIKNLIIKNQVELRYSQVGTLCGKIEFSSCLKFLKPKVKILCSIQSLIDKIEYENPKRKISFCRNCSNFHEHENKFQCSLDKFGYNSENIFKQVEYPSTCPFIFESIVLD